MNNITQYHTVSTARSSLEWCESTIVLPLFQDWNWRSIPADSLPLSSRSQSASQHRDPTILCLETWNLVTVDLAWDDSQNSQTLDESNSEHQKNEHPWTSLNSLTIRIIHYHIHYHTLSCIIIHHHISSYLYSIYISTQTFAGWDALQKGDFLNFHIGDLVFPPACAISTLA